MLLALADYFLKLVISQEPHRVFTLGHTGPRIFRGPAKIPFPALARGAWDCFHFAPPRSPSGAPHFRGPVFTVSGARFSSPPPIPRSGSPVFAGHRLGPRFRDPGNVNFWPFFSAKGTPDCKR